MRGLGLACPLGLGNYAFMFPSSLYRKSCLVPCILLACWMVGELTQVFGAEPVPDPDELPRIPATEATDAVRQFQVPPGFHMELVASEPLVMDPVAAAFDAAGGLYVVEMRGYSERREEHLGRVRYLSDDNGDGRMDRSQTLVDGLAWPTAVACWNGGVLVAATPDIWFFKDTTGDGKADVREKWFTGFGNGVSRLNVQALVNSLNWGHDGRLYGATARNGGEITCLLLPERPKVSLRGRDFSLDPRTLDFREESGTAQHGMSFDADGNRYVCSNSSHIQAVRYDWQYVADNPWHSLPSPLVDIPEDGPAAEVFRISPDEPWRIVRTRWRATGMVRGIVEGGGRVSGYFTAATGVTLYRGDAWPEEMYGQAIIGDAGSNLIHRKVLERQGVRPLARRSSSELDHEFVASPDNWFRPVQFINAPDGTLHVLDMYREVIEHPWSIPESIKSHLDLNSGNDRGRVYRLAPNGWNRRAIPDLSDAEPKDWLKLLSHRNAWHAETAARLLREASPSQVRPHALQYARRQGITEEGGGRLLYLLQDTGGIPQDILVSALQSPLPRVRRHAYRMMESRWAESWAATVTETMAGEKDLQAAYQLAWSLGRSPEAIREQVWPALAQTHYQDEWIREALLHAAGSSSASLFRALPVGHPAWQFLAPGLLSQMGKQADSQDLEWLGNWLASAPSLSEPFTFALEVAQSIPSGRRPPGVLQFLKEKASQAIVATESPGALDLLVALRDGRVTPVLLQQMKSVRAGVSDVKRLYQLTGPDFYEFVEQEGGVWTTAIRQAALDLWVGQTAQLPRLFEALSGGRVQAGWLTPSHLERLMRTQDPKLQKRAREMAEERGLGKSIQDQIVALQPALKLKGEPVRGKETYQERCAACHEKGDSAAALGPDRTSFLTQGQPRILVNILQPNAEVAPGYLAYEVETRDGEIHSGVLVFESATEVRLRQPGGLLSRFERQQIRELRGLGKSMMPEGLLGGLSHQQVADLLAFLVTPPMPE